MGARSAPIARPEEFGDVLRALILQSDPRRFPPAPGAAGRVTFARVAAALELSSERHLRKILSGDANITAAFLERLDELFELPGRGVVRARVYRSALGCLPTRVRAEESAASGGGGQIAQIAAVFDGAAFPLYVSSATWDILYTNETFDRWWPTITRVGNVMRAIMLDRQARSRMLEWERGWAGPVLTQLRSALTLMPQVYLPQVNALIDEVTADPIVRRLWLETPIVEVHGDGGERSALCPHGAPVELRQVGFAVEGLGLDKMIAIMPTKPHPCCFPEALHC